jgi:hypothetical protein
MQKRATNFSHCSSFDHPDVSSLDDYIFFFFCFATMIFNRFGACNIPLESYSQDLSNDISQARKFQTYQLVDQKSKYAFKFLSSRCPTLFDETCGSKFKG